jgi:hypothetical protein
MHEASVEKIQQQIIWRALEKSKAKEQERRVGDVVDSLEEMTDLPRSELGQIAAQVLEANTAKEDRFFSIKQQLLVTGATLLACFLLLAWFI